MVFDWFRGLFSSGTLVDKYYFGSLRVNDEEVRIMGEFYKVNIEIALDTFRKDLKEETDLSYNYGDIDKKIRRIISFEEQSAKLEAGLRVKAKRGRKDYGENLAQGQAIIEAMKEDSGLADAKINDLEKEKKLVGIRLKQKYDSLLILAEKLTYDVKDSKLGPRLKSLILDWPSRYGEVKNLANLRTVK